MIAVFDLARGQNLFEKRYSCRGMLRVVASEEPRRSEWTIAPIYMSQSHVRTACAKERREELEHIERVGVLELAEKRGTLVDRARDER